MFSEQMIRDIIAVAQRNSLEPAGMLAVVEIESSGRPFEEDGTTPRFLFERHVFHKQLSQRAPSKLAAAVSEGLAHPDWRRKTQYQDQKSVAGKLALLRRARAIDEDCANRSCSWGLGQVMGFHAEKFGFANATAMASSLVSGGVPGQLDLMAKFIRANSLADPLNQQNWERFAERYNGKGFRENRYDTKLRDAHTRWKAKIGSGPMSTAVTIMPSFASTILMMGSAGAEVRRVQQRLTELGYALGEIDGEFGTLTRGAVLTFQADNQLQPTGMVDAAMLAALPVAKPRPLSDARKFATEGDLRARGSGTIRLGDWIKRLGIGTGAVGGLGLLDANTGIVSKLFGFGAAPEVASTTAAAASGGIGSILSLGKLVFSAGTGGTGAIAMALAPVIFQVGKRIIARRVTDHQLGKNLGK